MTRLCLVLFLIGLPALNLSFAGPRSYGGENPLSSTSTRPVESGLRPSSEKSRSPSPGPKEVLDFLHSYNDLMVGYWMVSGDKWGKDRAAFPSSPAELAKILDKSFYPRAWTDGGSHDHMQARISPNARECILAAAAGVAYKGYVFLFPPPGAMAISGFFAGQKEHNWSSNYELIATPATYGNDTVFSYFVSGEGNNKAVWGKDLGRTTPTWSFFENERPLSPDGGWRNAVLPSGARPDEKMLDLLDTHIKATFLYHWRARVAAAAAAGGGAEPEEEVAKRIPFASFASESSQLLDRNFYPESWLRDGSYEAIRKDHVIPTMTALSQKPYNEYLFLMPSPDDMALSGPQAGAHPVDRLLGYELIATPNVYDKGKPLPTYFIAFSRDDPSLDGRVAVKDMGRSVTTWSAFANECPLAPNGDWNILNRNPDGSWPVVSWGATPPTPPKPVADEPKWRTPKADGADFSEDEKQGWHFARIIKASQDTYKKASARADPAKETYADSLQELCFPSFRDKNDNSTMIHPGLAAAVSRDKAFSGYIFLVPATNDPLLSGEENDFKRRFEAVITPAEYPQSGRYTFYVSSLSSDVRVKDLGRAIGSWKDLVPNDTPENVATWETIAN